MLTAKKLAMKITAQEKKILQQLKMQGFIRWGSMKKNKRIKILNTLIEKKLMTNMGQLTSLGIYAGKLKLSKGHICLSDNLEFEYFKRGGDIIRAECDAPVMPDGYRCGRYFHRDSYYQNNMEMIDEKMNAGHA